MTAGTLIGVFNGIVTAYGKYITIVLMTILGSSALLDVEKEQMFAHGK